MTTVMSGADNEKGNSSTIIGGAGSQTKISSSSSSNVTSSTATTNVLSPAPSGTPSPRPPTSPYSSLNKPLDDDLPNNVSSEEQLAKLPDFCISSNKERPLRHVSEMGEVYHYALKPMFYSVIFILLVELLERFSFYGINYTQTAFLTGAYDSEWNAGMSPVDASSYVSISTAVAYTMPFFGAYLADSLFGDYWSLLFGALVLYLPGLLLIMCSTVPYLLGDTFNRSALAFGLLLLWPMGTGVVKSIVNVFGARQFHPILQSSLIESYYVNFYMCINIGAIIGGVIVPVVAQHDITMAYSYPVAMLTCGAILFALGTPRYVRHRPTGDLFAKKTIESDGFDSSIGLGTIFRISALIVPFNIAYSQMSTVFIIQGTAMKKAFGFIDASTMNNADAVSVLFFGYIVGSKIYPALAKRDIKIPTTYKFALGSSFGAAAIGWSILLESKIRSTYEETGEMVNILWQTWSYVLIGAGEIFAVSAAYEVAFTSSPPDKKVLFSAVNLFCVGGLPNVLCIGLYQACSSWFLNSHGTHNISKTGDYVTAHVQNYFLVLFCIAMFGIFLNLMPFVREFVSSIEDRAADMVKTPVMKKSPRHRRVLSSDSAMSDEESPMIRVKRHQAYLKYGSGPVLYKQGSMRAGPSLSERSEEETARRKRRHVKRSFLGRLYKGKREKNRQVVLNSEGRPLTAGTLRRQDSI